jgi:prepilin-type N-terminal cleavage/methylation domain-containing protein
MQSKSNRNSQAFTLVELLVVISIIGFMSGMFIVAYRGASQESQVLKTRSTIQKISEVLNARMDEYVNFPLALRTSSIPLPPDVASWNSAMESAVTLKERARLLALRDLIRMEMPDHPDDLKYTTFWKTKLGFTGYPVFLPKTIPTGLGNTFVSPIPGFGISAPFTARTTAMMNRLSAATSPIQPLKDWDDFNANAELLYLIVEGSDLNGTSAIELFGKSEIGDTDRDGLNEFIDAFGTPIRWIRWPAGFAGASRYYPDMLDPSLVSSANRLVVNSEPIDRLGTDPGWGTPVQKPGIGLTPLVISAGLDGKFGIRFREINRNNLPASIPIAVGTYGSVTSYSSAEAPWVESPSKYGLSGFTDPWFPRDPTVIGVRMGETVSASDLNFENGVPVGPVHAGDNISNFDGTAVSL